jgi:transcriptional regulator with XRE-family HTH domain
VCLFAFVCAFRFPSVSWCDTLGLPNKERMIQMTISHGTRIKELRVLSGMSQEELGRRVGVQRAAINKYEKGSVTNIPIKTIEKIAQVFDVSPTYIVGWDSTPSNPLAAEVKVLQGVKRFYGADTVELIESFIQLNHDGRERVLHYAEDMGLIYEDTKTYI